MNWLRKRPWLPFVGAFIAFVMWWVFFIILAVQNQPEQVPLPASFTQAHGGH